MMDWVGTSWIRAVSSGTCSSSLGGSNCIGSGSVVRGGMVVSCSGDYGCGGDGGYGGDGGCSVIMVVYAVVSGSGSSVM
jgi:hypothetical protein